MKVVLPKPKEDQQHNLAETVELVRTAVLQQYQRQSSAKEKKLQASDPHSTTNQKGFEVSFIPGRRVLGERCVSQALSLLSSAKKAVEKFDSYSIKLCARCVLRGALCSRRLNASHAHRTKRTHPALLKSLFSTAASAVRTSLQAFTG